MDELKGRIEKLEETAAFIERTVEQLNEQVLRAVEGLEMLTRRLRALEARLAAAENNAAGDVPDGDDDAE